MPGMQNPFRPTFGRTPPELIDRNDTLEEFEYGLRIRSGVLGLLTIITGARGVGKTVMLNEAQGLAQEQGWAIISETSTAGFLARIADSAVLIDEELGDGPPPRKILAFTAAGFGVTTQLPRERQVEFRNLGAKLLRRLDENGTGLLITLDEIQDADRSELLQLAAVIQHWVRDGLPISFVCAGLPAAISDILNEGVATFLRRADKIDLHSVEVRDVRDSYARQFSAAGILLPEGFLEEAAEATFGYPFLIQLIGYFLWKEAERGEGVVDRDSADRAVAAALKRNIRMVVGPAISKASDRDMDYLRAMSHDSGPSSTAAVAQRMKASLQLAANYRARLIEAGLIEPAGRGEVRYSIPGLREHLRNGDRLG
ncbi:ATP-binding protein [Paeniglutamicibacter sp.]|uniref:ATP-binding protein n=1 Tax=Paeniglutamicibacter sp. TaxID=1934391 RepID=UPI0039899138